MNMNENSLGHVHLAYDKLLGDYQCRGRLDLLNIVLIGLSNELPEHDGQYELHRLLGTLLSKRLSADEKLNIIETEYDIPVVDDIRRDVYVMCNLSQGIREEGREQGIIIGETKIIMNMYNNGFTIQQIADTTGIEVEEVKDIIEGSAFVLA